MVNQKIKLVGIILILIALPLTILLAQRVQNYINHAAGPDGKLIMGISLPGGNAAQEGRETQTLAEIDAFASQIGQYPGTYSIWNNFGLPGETTSDGASTAFPSQTLLDGLTARNITPVIFMQPVGSGIHLPSGADPNNPPATAKKYSNASIANGSFDAYLTKWAQAAKAYNKPVILRYAHEMNQTWFPWGPYKDGKRYYNVGNSSANYVSAWRHVYNVIHPIAPKVKFFWCPWLGDFIPFYPGNNYVDYVGFDAYDSLDKDKTMQDLYDNPILKLRTMVTGSSTTQSPKPIIIGETGIDLRFPNPKRSDWITNGYSAMYNKYPDVAAIIYFNFGNWELNSNGGLPENKITSAYANLASQPKFQGRFPPFTASPPPTPKPTATPTKKPTPTFTPPPTPKPTATPTKKPTPTFTPPPTPKPTATPTPKPTPVPTGTPTPSPLPGETILHLASIKLHGIGTGGDNANPKLPGNQNPLTTIRTLTVELYNTTGSLLSSAQGNIVYSAANGGFSGDVKLNTSVATGSYLVKVKTNKYLKKQLVGIISLTKGITNQMPNVTLGVGDIDGDGYRRVPEDYNLLMDCYSDLAPARNCDPTKKSNSDLSDDGKVNQDDYNLFLRELSVLTGD